MAKADTNPLPGFEFITLETRDGGFVHRPMIPIMQPRPEAVTWGTRFFIAEPCVEGGRPVYKEGLCYVIIEPQELKKSLSNSPIDTE